MPQGRIKPQFWFVEFGLDVSAAPCFAVDGYELAQPTAVPPSDSEIQLRIKDVIDNSNQGGRRIGSLQHVSFAYKSTYPADTNAGSSLQHSKYCGCGWICSWYRVHSGNWKQHDIILAFFSDCERGSRARVVWLCSGDPSRALQVSSRTVGTRTRVKLHYKFTLCVRGGNVFVRRGWGGGFGEVSPVSP